MSTANRYPLSTPDGKAIPLDLIKPMGVLRLPFTASAYNAQSINAIYQDKIFTAYSTEDCYLSFAASPGAIADNTVTANILFVPAGVMIAFITNSLYLAAKGVSVSGSVHVQIVDTWAGLLLEAQVNRR